MPTELVEPPSPSNAEPNSMASLMDSFVKNNPLPNDPAPVVQPPVVEPETPIQTPQAPPTEEPVQPPAPTGAARRLDQEKATLKSQLEERQKLLDEQKKQIDDYDARWKETSTKLTETETVSQERQRKLDEMEGYYRNQESLLNIDPMSLEPVRQAAVSAKSALDKFLPTDISAGDESPLPVNPEAFLRNNQADIHQLVKDWQSVSAMDVPSAARGQMQHVILSTMASRLGVGDEHFDEREINGSTFKVINPSHPVFQQMKRNIGDLVNYTNQFDKLRSEAQSAPLETARQQITNRQRDSVASIRKSGIGLTGDDLKAALKQNPNDPNLQIMQAMESHPELLTELEKETELEAMVNGHVVRRFDIPETEPAERSKKGHMLSARWDQRAREAPLVQPLKKLFVLQVGQMREKDAEIARLKSELESYVNQGEPGGSRDNGTGTKPLAAGLGWADASVAKYLQG